MSSITITLKNNYDYNSRLLFTDTDSLMYQIKTEDLYEDFRKDKEMFDFSNYSADSKYYNASKKLVVGKIKDEAGGVAIKIFAGLKPKMYSFLVDNNSEHKKAKCLNKNVVATISHGEYKDFFSNNKSLRHSMNRIQSKDHRIETYENNKIPLSCFDNKIYI